MSTRGAVRRDRRPSVGPHPIVARRIRTRHDRTRTTLKRTNAAIIPTIQDTQTLPTWITASAGLVTIPVATTRTTTWTIRGNTDGSRVDSGPRIAGGSAAEAPGASGSTIGTGAWRPLTWAMWTAGCGIRTIS